MTTGLPRRADVPPGSSTGRLAGVPTRRTFLLGGAGIAAAGLVGAGVGVEQGVLPGRPFLQAAPRAQRRGRRHPRRRAGPGRSRTRSSQRRARRGRDRLVAAAAAGHRRATAAPRRRRAARARCRPRHAHRTGSSGSTATSPQHVEDGGRRSPSPRRRRPWLLAPARAVTTPARWSLDELLPILEERGYDTSSTGVPGLVDGRVRRAPARPALRGPDRRRGGQQPGAVERPRRRVAAGFADADGVRASTASSTTRPTSSGIPVRVDIGTGDPFYRDVEDYVGRLPERRRHVTSTFEPGGHTPGYWRRMLPAQLEFLGDVAV